MTSLTPVMLPRKKKIFKSFQGRNRVKSRLRDFSPEAPRISSFTYKIPQVSSKRIMEMSDPRKNSDDSHLLKELIKSEREIEALLLSLRQEKSEYETIKSNKKRIEQEISHLQSHYNEIDAENKRLQERTECSEAGQRLKSVEKELFSLKLKEKELTSTVLEDEEIIKNYEAAIFDAEEFRNKEFSENILKSNKKQFILQDIEYSKKKNKELKLMIAKEEKAWQKMIEKAEENLQKQRSEIYELEKQLKTQNKSCRMLILKSKKLARMKLDLKSKTPDLELLPFF